MPEHINYDIEISSEDSDREETNEKISNEENSDEEKYNKNIKYRMRLFLCLKHFNWF